MFYKEGKPKDIIPKKAGARCAANIFRSIKQEDEVHHIENTTKELTFKIYDDLDKELALAALLLPWLAPVLKERKQATPDTQNSEPPPATHAADASSPRILVPN